MRRVAQHANKHTQVIRTIPLEELAEPALHLLIEATMEGEETFAERSEAEQDFLLVPRPRITLSADVLRTSGPQISGAGGGLTAESVAEGASQAWEWIKAGKLHADIERIPLREVQRAWKRADGHGKRIVIVP